VPSGAVYWTFCKIILQSAISIYLSIHPQKKVDCNKFQSFDRGSECPVLTLNTLSKTVLEIRYCAHAQTVRSLMFESK